MKTKIGLSALLILLFFIGLIIIGAIGANVSLNENVSFQLLSFKFVFLGMIKIAPLVLIAGFTTIIIQKLNKPNE